jgi:hypothetical protein
MGTSALFAVSIKAFSKMIAVSLRFNLPIPTLVLETRYVSAELLVSRAIAMVVETRTGPASFAACGAAPG